MFLFPHSSLVILTHGVIFCWSLRFLYTADHRYGPSINGLLTRNSSLWMWCTSTTSLDQITVPRWSMMHLLMRLNMSASMKDTSMRVDMVYRVLSSVSCLCCCLTLNSVALKTTVIFPSLLWRSQLNQEMVKIVFLYPPASENINHRISMLLRSLGFTSMISGCAGNKIHGLDDLFIFCKHSVQIKPFLCVFLKLFHLIYDSVYHYLTPTQ